MKEALFTGNYNLLVHVLNVFIFKLEIFHLVILRWGCLKDKYSVLTWEWGQDTAILGHSSITPFTHAGMKFYHTP